MDEQEYLNPGFDPSTLTVPRLRSILVAHSVDYPSTAKKSQLIDLFNEQVLPRAGRLRAAAARVRRTSRGIENVAQGNTDDSLEEEEEIRPLRSTTKTARRTTRARTEEAEELAPPSRSTRHSTAPPEHTPRRSSSKHGRTVEEQPAEPEPKRIVNKKSRTSVATPAPVKREQEDGSPFSNDNVFQSGSSPTAAPPSTDRRRTTSGAARNINHTPARESRRRTTEHQAVSEQQDGVVVPTRRTFDVPVSRLGRPSIKQEIDTTEEFTPEEEQALVRSGNSGALVRTNRKSASKSAAKTGLPAIFTVLLATFGYFWSEEKFKVGYCGVGHPSTEIAGVAIPDWADVLRPPCEPCPPHAYCQDDLKTICEPGFVLTQHPLSMGGLLPFAPTCEPDSARARKIDAVKQRAVEELREQNARFECGEASKPEVKETDLKRAISTRRRRDMSNEEFEDLWASALGELQSIEEITSAADGIGNTILRSNSLAKLPIGCAIRRSIRETIRRYVWTLVMVAFVASSGVYGRYQITTSRSNEQRAKESASLALDKLSEQASLHAAEPERWEEGFISVAQLRDDVLRNDFSSTRRKKIWEKVQKKVEGNANVRPMVREGRAGDVGRVWEWVGAVRAIESPQSIDRRRSSGYRDSFGGLAGDRLLTPGEQHSGGKVVRWQEQGQYY